MNIDFSKLNGLIPAVIQDADTKNVLMVGFMNEEAYQKTIETKEIRLSPNIDTNDLNTKVNQAKKFLQKGAKVKVSLRFRGREMAHKDVGREILNAFFEELKDVASVDKPAKMEGRSMVMFLSATK